MDTKVTTPRLYGQTTKVWKAFFYVLYICIKYKGTIRKYDRHWTKEREGTSGPRSPWFFYQKVSITVNLANVPKVSNLLFEVYLLLPFLLGLCPRQSRLPFSWNILPSSPHIQTPPVLQGFKCLLYFPHPISETRSHLSLLLKSTVLCLYPS